MHSIQCDASCDSFTVTYGIQAQTACTQLASASARSLAEARQASQSPEQVQRLEFRLIVDLSPKASVTKETGNLNDHQSSIRTGRNAAARHDMQSRMGVSCCFSRSNAERLMGRRNMYSTSAISDCQAERDFHNSFQFQPS